MIGERFGHWLAGFVAGEGCFDIRNRDTGFTCRFAINLRADDVDILKRIQRELGVGRIHKCKNRDIAPNCKFEVDTKEGCLLICDLFNLYPLRAKKAKDFDIWKQAVYLWKDVEYSNRWNSARNDYVWKCIGDLKEELYQCRTYKEVL